MAVWLNDPLDDEQIEDLSMRRDRQELQVRLTDIMAETGFTERQRCELVLQGEAEAIHHDTRTEGEAADIDWLGWLDETSAFDEWLLRCALYNEYTGRPVGGIAVRVWDIVEQMERAEARALVSDVRASQYPF